MINPTRRSHRILIIIAVAAGCLSAAGSALAYSSGPPNALTNAPGESNCTACHASFPLNSGTGLLEIIGLPAEYAPDATYPLEVKLSDPSAQRWGFELTVIDVGGTSRGTLIPLDLNTQTSTGGAFSRTYLKHTSQGTNFGQTGQNTWQFQWKAPGAGTGAVSIYAAGNAANGNGSTSGDRIYTSTATSDESSLSPVPEGLFAAQLHQPYPNPFNPRTVIAFTLEEPGRVNLEIFNVRGERVQRLYAGEVEAGDHNITWRGVSDAGEAQPSGLYFARLTDGRGRDLAAPVRMVLAR